MTRNRAPLPRATTLILGALMLVVLFVGWRAAVPFYDFPADARFEKSWHLMQLERSRVLVVTLAAAAVILLGMHHRRVRARLKDFFGQPGGPINLAVLRIVVFWQLFKAVNVTRLVWYSQFPEIFRIPPLGLDWANRDVLFHEDVITIACTVFFVCCVGAIVGVFTRLCSIATVLMALYLLGIPHFDGKVDHGLHHLVWFAALLAASPCGDVLSLDALRRAWTRPRHGPPRELLPSVAYALPIRFVWLLLGVLYFFPGFWKIWACGFHWALGDNLKLHMYAKWAEFNGWTPSFRIDQHPLLYRAGGVATIVFEMGFFFCVFFPAGRIVAWFSGLGFHWSNAAILRIRFKRLQWCYVALVDWHSLLRWVGGRLFPRQLVLTYRSESVSAGRLVGILRALDLFGRIKCVAGVEASVPGVEDRTETGVAPDKVPANVSFVARLTGGIAPLGEAGARFAVLRRMPLLWWLFPVACVIRPGWLSSHRAKPQALRKRPVRIERVRGRHAATWIVGGALLLGNISLGWARELEAWPFSCYPTFAYYAGPISSRIELEFIDTQGEVMEVSADLFGSLGKAGAIRLQRGILALEDPAERKRRLHAFMGMLYRGLPSGVEVSEIRLFRVIRNTEPGSTQSQKTFVGSVTVHREDR